jgi:hypothetical protein
MKKVIFLAVLSSFMFVACNNAQSDAHTHEDGTTHTDCDNEHDSNHSEQEVFEVEADSTHECSHDSVAEEASHSHTHEDGTVH